MWLRLAQSCLDVLYGHVWLLGNCVVDSLAVDGIVVPSGIAPYGHAVMLFSVKFWYDVGSCCRVSSG